MLIVALTGGIGSGKSSVAEQFAALGVPVIDADVLAREQVAPGMPALEEIRSHFGDAVLTAQGALDRHRLRDRVFADPAGRKHLEAILHPRIRQDMQRRVLEMQAPYAILVVPLLLETGQKDLAERILVVDMPEEMQIRRVMQRDHQTREQVQAIMAAQFSRDQRLAAADDVIENDGDMQALIKKTRNMHNRYMLLSHHR